MDAARRVFEAMGVRAERDGVCVLAHAQLDEALDVYHCFDALHDDVSPLLAVRCCLQVKDAELGQDIFARVAHPTLQLKNVLIDLLGKSDMGVARGRCSTTLATPTETSSL